MKVTRIYTGEDNQSHFEDLDIPMKPTQNGVISELVPAQERSSERLRRALHSPFIPRRGASSSSRSAVWVN